MKIKLQPIIEIKFGVVFGACFFGVLCIIMAIRTLNFGPQEFEYSPYFEKLYIAPNTFIVNAFESDSTETGTTVSELRFENQNQLSKDKQWVSINLMDQQYALLPYVYTAYYAIFFILWMALFYNLYKYTRFTEKGDLFDEQSIGYLYRCSRLLGTAGIYYLFAHMSITLLISQLTDAYVHPPFDAFEFLFIIIVLGMGGALLRLFVRMAVKGHELKTDQDYTV